MADADKTGTDLLGIEPAAKAIEVAANTASELFLAVCKPAAVELGEYFADKVRGYRHKNAVEVLALAVDIVRRENAEAAVSAPPALVYRILEEGSWEDTDELKAIWAGLLASACSEEGTDDGNKIFLRIVRGLTGLQVRILFEVCRKVPKFVSAAGLPACGTIEATIAAVKEISGTSDLQQLDRELDDLRHLGLIELSGGFVLGSPDPHADLSPTPLALNFYVRCQGSRKSVGEYFGAPTMADSHSHLLAAMLLKGADEP